MRETELHDLAHLTSLILQNKVINVFVFKLTANRNSAQCLQSFWTFYYELAPKYDNVAEEIELREMRCECYY